jgi:hypothetical protein
MATANLSTTDNNWLSGIESGIGTAAGAVGGAFGTVAGLQLGGAKGYETAATSAAKAGANLGAFGSASGTVGSLAADVANLSNIITGVQQGGVTGYGSAGINAAALGARTGAFGTYSSAVGAAAAPLASALSVYNFAKQWQSGATGADALRGAQTGATIGTEFAPGVGTLAGAAIGAAVGAASSLFGPGRMDPENIGWDQYAQAYQQGGAAGVAGASPAQNFQMLSGIFDARGSNIPFYNQFGRMGENQFMSSMTSQINQALKSGTVSPTDSASTIYSKVVQPWINSMSPGGWQNTSTAKGAPEKDAIGNLLTNMIGQWQSGQLTSASKVGIAGQTIQGLQAFGAQGYPPGQQQAQASGQQAVQQVTTAQDQLVNIFAGSGFTI